MKTYRTSGWLVGGLVLLAVGCFGAELDSVKAELMGRVEDFLMHNFKDVTARKSLAWGDVETAVDGSRSIRYEYEARIWDKETKLMNQVFTFDKAGKFVRFQNLGGFPKPKLLTPVDTLHASRPAGAGGGFLHPELPRRDPPRDTRLGAGHQG